MSAKFYGNEVVENLTAIIIFHGEKYLAPTSIRSYLRCCQRAEEAGVPVQRIAVIDRADPLTSEIIRLESGKFDHVEWVDFGDLGRSRNLALELSDSNNIAFLDGDDLWGSEWLVKGLRILIETKKETIVHPEVIHYFSADDYLLQSRTETPNSGLKSYYFLQIPSTDPEFDARAVMFNNIWTANTIALKRTFVAHPYLPVNREDGFGVEDWTWNAQTLAAGLEHAIAPDTVHCIRLKSEGSLGVQNTEGKIIPQISAYWRELERY